MCFLLKFSILSCSLKKPHKMKPIYNVTEAQSVSPSHWIWHVFSWWCWKCLHDFMSKLHSWKTHFRSHRRAKTSTPDYYLCRKSSSFHSSHERQREILSVLRLVISLTSQTCLLNYNETILAFDKTEPSAECCWVKWEPVGSIFPLFSFIHEKWNESRESTLRGEWIFCHLRHRPCRLLKISI